MNMLAIQNRAEDIYNSIIKRIMDPDILNSVILELYKEEDINSAFGIYENDTIPDIQKILVDLANEHTETIEYFYQLCEEDDLIPGAIERYQDEIFPCLEDFAKLSLLNAGYLYRDSSRELNVIYNDRAIPCQNSLFAKFKLNIMGV